MEISEITSGNVENFTIENELSLEEHQVVRVAQGTLAASQERMPDDFDFTASTVPLSFNGLVTALKTKLLFGKDCRRFDQLLSLAAIEAAGGLNAKKTVKRLCYLIKNSEALPFSELNQEVSGAISEDIPALGDVAFGIAQLALIGWKAPHLEKCLIDALVTRIKVDFAPSATPLVGALIMYTLQRGYIESAKDLISVCERLDAKGEGSAPDHLDALLLPWLISMVVAPLSQKLTSIEALDQNAVEKFRVLIERLVNSSVKGEAKPQTYAALYRLQGSSFDEVASEFEDREFAALILSYAAMTYSLEQPDYASEILKEAIALGGGEKGAHESVNESIQLVTQVSDIIFTGLALKNPEADFDELTSLMDQDLLFDEGMIVGATGLALLSFLRFLKGDIDMAVDIFIQFLAPLAATFEFGGQVLGFLSEVIPERREDLLMSPPKDEDRDNDIELQQDIDASIEAGKWFRSCLKGKPNNALLRELLLKSEAYELLECNEHLSFDISDLTLLAGLLSSAKLLRESQVLQ